MTWMLRSLNLIGSSVSEEDVGSLAGVVCDVMLGRIFCLFGWCQPDDVPDCTSTADGGLAL